MSQIEGLTQRCSRSYQMFEFLRVWQQPFLAQLCQIFSMAYMQTRCSIVQVSIFCWFLGHVCPELMREHFQGIEGHIPTRKMVGNGQGHIPARDIVGNRLPTITFVRLKWGGSRQFSFRVVQFSQVWYADESYWSVSAVFNWMSVKEIKLIQNSCVLWSLVLVILETDL